MKFRGTAVVSLVAFIGLVVGMKATSSPDASGDSAYGAIMDRNVFSLRPMPAQTGPTTPPAPAPNVKLVGLMMISGRPQGVFSILDQSGPNKQPATYILAEDERQASLEVKSINMTAETARVQIGEDIMELKLEEPKGPTGPAPAPAGLAGGPAQRPFMGGQRGARGTFPMPNFPGGRGYNPAPAAPSYAPSTTPDGGLPTRPVRTDSTDAAQQSMTAEQSLVQMEQTRNMYQQNNDPRASLLPPNPLQQALDAQNASQQTGNAADTTSQNQSSTQQLPAYLRARTSGNYPLPPMPGH